jgi:hypothetical protein
MITKIVAGLAGMQQSLLLFAAALSDMSVFSLLTVGVQLCSTESAHPSDLLKLSTLIMTAFLQKAAVAVAQGRQGRQGAACKSAASGLCRLRRCASAVALLQYHNYVLKW